MALGQSQPRTLSLHLRIFLMPSPKSPSPARTGQGRGMEFLGFALLAILIIWVAATLVTQPLAASAPGAGAGQRSWWFRDGRQGDGVGALTGANRSCPEYVGAHRYQWSSQLVDWAGFGLTSAITLIAVPWAERCVPARIRPLPSAKGLQAQTATSTRRWANIVGAIAATASIMIGLSSRLQSESQRQLGQAKNLRQLITSARKDYLSAPGPEEMLR